MVHAVMPIVVIAAFRPKPGGEQELLSCLRDHMPLMRRLAFVTDREAIVMRSTTGGEVLEVFEWASQEAIDAAHKHPEVLTLWQRYEACCESITLDDFAEAKQMFPGFEPVSFGVSRPPPLPRHAVYAS